MDATDFDTWFSTLETLAMPPSYYANVGNATETAGRNAGRIAAIGDALATRDQAALERALGDRATVGDFGSYVRGVVCGRTASRKNASGKRMEQLMHDELAAIGLPFRDQVRTDDIAASYGIDMSPIANLGRCKRFDYLVQGRSGLFAIEINYYGTSGSKPNEIARAYQLIDREMRGMGGIDFVWVTDGPGWKASKDNLREAYANIGHVYDIADVRDGRLSAMLSA